MTSTRSRSTCSDPAPDRGLAGPDPGRLGLGGGRRPGAPRPRSGPCFPGLAAYYDLAADRFAAAGSVLGMAGAAPPRYSPGEPFPAAPARPGAGQARRGCAMPRPAPAPASACCRRAAGRAATTRRCVPGSWCLPRADRRWPRARVLPARQAAPGWPHRHELRPRRARRAGRVGARRPWTPSTCRSSTSSPSWRVRRARVPALRVRHGGARRGHALAEHRGQPVARVLLQRRAVLLGAAGPAPVPGLHGPGPGPRAGGRRRAAVAEHVPRAHQGRPGRDHRGSGAAHRAPLAGRGGHWPTTSAGCWRCAAATATGSGPSTPCTGST